MALIGQIDAPSSVLFMSNQSLPPSPHPQLHSPGLHHSAFMSAFPLPNARHQSFLVDLLQEQLPTMAPMPFVRAIIFLPVLGHMSMNHMAQGNKGD